MFHSFAGAFTEAHLLQWPLVLTSIASRAFTVAALTVWNSLLTAVLVLNVDSSLNCLHLLMRLRTVQHHRSAPICVFNGRCFINHAVVVVVVVYIQDVSSINKSVYFFWHKSMSHCSKNQNCTRNMQLCGRWSCGDA